MVRGMAIEYRVHTVHAAHAQHVRTYVYRAHAAYHVPSAAGIYMARYGTGGKAAGGSGYTG